MPLVPLSKLISSHLLKVLWVSFGLEGGWCGLMTGGMWLLKDTAGGLASGGGDGWGILLDRGLVSLFSKALAADGKINKFVDFQNNYK